MGHKSFVTRYIELVEICRIDYPEEFDSNEIARYNMMIAEGADVPDLPDDVTYDVLSSLELYGERMEEWEQESEYMPVVEAMITTIREYTYTLEQFQWYLGSIPPEDYFKFLIYLYFHGFSGEEDEMIKEFHEKYYS